MITDESVKALFDACQGRDLVSGRDTAIIRVLFDTGARLSEMANLTVEGIKQMFKRRGHAHIGNSVWAIESDAPCGRALDSLWIEGFRMISSGRPWSGGSARAGRWAN